MNANATVPQPAEVFTVVPGKNETGKPIFSVLVKRTYDIRAGQPAVRAERTNPLVQLDVYYDEGDPETHTVKYEHDLAPCKPATDVVLIGKAYAPGGKAVPELDVALEVGSHKKVIRVRG